MQIGIVGKTNVGKTTFFSAATLVDAEISNRVFTTIKPNVGVGYAAVPCVCRELGVACQPRNSKCVNGTRLIPVRLIDVAGLVPGAHKGKGLGNQFLSDIMEAQALINVVDASGGTDEEGRAVKPGTHEPMDDVFFLEKEIDYWIWGIMQKSWHSICRKVSAGGEKLPDAIHKQLSGLGITIEDVHHVFTKMQVDEKSTEDDMLKFIDMLRKRAKPMIVAANKADIPEAGPNIKKMQETEIMTVPCSAESELALRKAEREGDIKYVPGDGDFELIKTGLEPRKLKALEFIKNDVLKKFGGTGVQQCVNRAVFDLLGMIVIYPVENETRYTSGKGNVLPDAFLVPRGTTARQLAGIIHTDFLEKFVAAVDAKKKQRIAADHQLQNGDVIKIMLAK